VVRLEQAVLVLVVVMALLAVTQLLILAQAVAVVLG